MIFSPSILALLIGSGMVTAMAAYACYYGRLIVAAWDIHSGSELQLELERRTCLISTIVSYALGFQFVSLFLFVYTADRLAPLFIGAMCAAGSLNVNHWGYLTLTFKVVNLVLAGVWLVLNHTDSRSPDYPLVRPKYIMLMWMLPFVAGETIAQGEYFFALRPNVITSCCGSLFTSESAGAMGTLLGLPRLDVEIVFGLSMAATLALAGYVRATGKGAYALSFSSGAAFVISIVAIISVVSVYFYELPTHHCPFCILQKEYGGVGYPLYFSLLMGTVTGIGAGVIERFRTAPSLTDVVPRIQRNLALASLLSYLAFLGVVGYGVAASNLRM